MATNSKSNAYKAPEWLLKVALDDKFRVTETKFAKDGSPYEVTRRADLKERLSAAKDAANYFASKMPTLEVTTVRSASADKTDDELRAEFDRLTAILTPVKASHAKAKDQAEAPKGEGSDSEGAVGEPVQQATDAPGQDEASQP